MKIERAEARHADGILALLIQVNNVHSEARPDLFLWNKTKYRKDELLSLLADDSRPVFVAVEGGTVLGYVFGIFQSHKEDYNWPDITTFYVDDLCVDEACRGRGIGKALFAFVREYAKARGCYNLTLNVWEKNDTARAFYESQGLGVQKTGLEMIL